jgi:hypothetical protein
VQGGQSLRWDVRAVAHAARTAYVVRRQLFLWVSDNYFSLSRVDSSLLLPNAARCLMKNVTRPQGRDEWQIEEATERGNETGTD